MERPSAPNARGGEVLPLGARPLAADDPTVIDGHRLTGRLSSGGTSIVYLARNADGEHVVVKTTRARKADQTQARRWLRTEASSARRLPPFCTARLLADGTEHSPPYLVSEYVEGPSLAQFVEGLGPLEPDQLMALGVALARALAAIHGAGLIHCDLKPANIMLAADGPRVIDFSIAQEAPISGKPAEIGTVPYSPGWVAPERVSGYPAAPSSDIFGWGCVIGYAATGQSPFEGDDGDGQPGVARAAALDALEQPLRALVEAALSVDPADRPSTGEIASRLGPGDVRASRPAREAPKRRSMSSVDAPTAPMRALTAEPDPIELAADSAAAMAPQEPPARADTHPRRLEYTAETGEVASRNPSAPAPGTDPPPRRVEYASDATTAAFGPRTGRNAEPERRPRKLRTVAMVAAPAVAVAVLATVIAMASTGAGRQEQQADPAGAASPGGQPPADSQAPTVSGPRSHGPYPASASSTPGSSTPTAGHRRHARHKAPGGTQSPGSHPPSPPPPPTHTPSPSPTPTPTGTVTPQGGPGSPAASA